LKAIEDVEGCHVHLERHVRLTEIRGTLKDRRRGGNTLGFLVVFATPSALKCITEIEVAAAV
jgi:hypothetical protein